MSLLFRDTLIAREYAEVLSSGGQSDWLFGQTFSNRAGLQSGRVAARMPLSGLERRVFPPV